MYDGVDYIPMPRWKTFLIQLLNIAGLGPIFGAVLGATYGPVAFLWITLGGIFMGAMHDFIAGVMSLNHNGASLPEIIGKYLGMTTKQVMRLFAVVMMILVGAVKEIFALASSIMEQYASGKLSRVYVIYHHFKSSAVQKVERLTYLPLEISSYKKEQKATADGWLNNYIVEPSVSQVIESLMPQLLKQKLYTCLADSYASEHAARTIAMQVATDNAEDLIQELTILYNKSRQQAITAELLDIVAGSSQ